LADLGGNNAFRDGEVRRATRKAKQLCGTKPPPKPQGFAGSRDDALILRKKAMRNPRYAVRSEGVGRPRRITEELLKNRPSLGDIHHLNTRHRRTGKYGNVGRYRGSGGETKEAFDVCRGGHINHKPTKKTFRAKLFQRAVWGN